MYTPVYRHIIIHATVYRHYCVILPCCFYVIFAFCLLLFWLWAWNPVLRHFCSYCYLTSAIISSTIITTLIPILFIILEIYPYTSLQLSTRHAYSVVFSSDWRLDIFRCQVVRSFLLRCQDFTKIFDLHGDGVIRADEFLDFGRQVFGVDLWKLCYPLLMDIQVIGVIWFLYCPNEIVIVGSITLYGIQTHSRSTFSLVESGSSSSLVTFTAKMARQRNALEGSMIQGWLLYENLVMISIIILTQKNPLEKGPNGWVFPAPRLQQRRQWKSWKIHGVSRTGTAGIFFASPAGRNRNQHFCIMHSASGRTCQMLEHENGSTSCHSSCLLFVLKVTDFYLLSFGDGTLIQGNRNEIKMTCNEQGLT